MPTVVLLDVSLSMSRPTSRQIFNAKINQEPLEIRQLANIGIGSLLDYLAQNSSFEYASLVVFSSLWELRSQFTRDHESIKNNLYELELYDKSNIINALRGTLSLGLEEWSQYGIVNIIIVTDGHLHPDSMNDKWTESGKKNKGDFNDIALSELEGQFDFPCKIQIVCLASQRDPALKHSLKFFKELIEIVSRNNQLENTVITPANMTAANMHPDSSAIWLPESNSLTVSVQSVENLFSSLAEIHYKPHYSVISFGHLSSKVVLSPRPQKASVFYEDNDFDESKGKDGESRVHDNYLTVKNMFPTYELSEDINICGFMSVSKVASPAIISRHHVYPVPDSRYDEVAKAQQVLSQDPNAYSKPMEACSSKEGQNQDDLRPALGPTNLGHNQDITKQPSFCVLLHNSLRQENMIAICIVGKSDDSNEDWYGLLHPYFDSRKRSSLMLSILVGGRNPVLWLPSFRNLGSASLADVSTLEKLGRQPGPSKSYSSNNVIWLDPESVQADVQKIVRHAKRAPDKAPHFYKELNRVRRAAISYGFFDVLSGLASILERERRLMSTDQNKSPNPETLKHIDHVVRSLREKLTDSSYDTQIVPPM